MDRGSGSFALPARKQETQVRGESRVLQLPGDFELVKGPVKMFLFSVDFGTV